MNFIPIFKISSGESSTFLKKYYWASLIFKKIFFCKRTRCHENGEILVIITIFFVVRQSLMKGREKRPPPPHSLDTSLLKSQHSHNECYIMVTASAKVSPLGRLWSGFKARCLGHDIRYILRCKLRTVNKLYLKNKLLNNGVAISALNNYL